MKKLFFIFKYISKVCYITHANYELILVLNQQVHINLLFKINYKNFDHIN